MNATRAAVPTTAGQGAGRLQTIVVLAIVAAVIAVATVIIGGNGQASGLAQVTLTGNVADSAPLVGSVPPGFEAVSYDGKTIDLANYAGKPLWLTFGASWCPDCRAEAPDVEAAYQKYQAQGLAVVGVFISESASDVKSYAEHVGFTFPIAVDQNTVIASQYRTMGIPTHFFIGADGRIKDVRIGALDPATMDSEIQAILSK